MRTPHPRLCSHATPARGGWPSSATAATARDSPFILAHGRRLGLDVVLTRRWNPEARRYQRVAGAVARSAPDTVYVAGLLDANGGRLIRDLRARLPAGTQLIANDGFLPVAKLFESAGPSARGVHITRSGLSPDSLPPEGRDFVAEFAATQGSRPVYFESVYAAQAAELLLDAIPAPTEHAVRSSPHSGAPARSAACSEASRSTPRAT